MYEIGEEMMHIFFLDDHHNLFVNAYFDYYNEFWNAKSIKDLNLSYSFITTPTEIFAWEV